MTVSRLGAEKESHDISEWHAHEHARAHIKANAYGRAHINTFCRCVFVRRFCFCFRCGVYVFLFHKRLTQIL